MSSSSSSSAEDIEELHLKALQQGSTTYIDPETGFTVFTELFHLQRGTCCGNQCRHCPYGWSNVGNGARRPASVKSGDVSAVQQRLQELMHSEQGGSPAGQEVLRSIEIDDDDDQLTPGKGGRHGGKHTAKNVPYTRKGDKGTAQLLTGERRSKQDAAFEAMGTVDELCSIVGVAHAELTGNNAEATERFRDLPEWLLEIMSRLFDIGSHVAKPPKLKEGDTPSFEADGVGGGFHQSHVDQLEDWIDVLTEQLPELRSFILPTGSKGAAQLHVARTVCRRAERCVVGLVENGVCDPNALKYLNRLSDFFFVAARWANYCQGRDEIQYRREERTAKQRNRTTVSLQHDAKKK